MEINEIMTFLKRKWLTVALFALSMASLAFVFSIVQPQKYRAEQRFLVVQTYAEDVDPYAASRSTEYLTNLFSEVMYSQSFMNQVFAAGYGVDKTSFPTQDKKLKKAWQKTIRTRVLGDTGILDVSVYHKDRYQAEQLALAVGQVLRTKHTQYHGRGRALQIQIIDQPIVSLRPVQPNILLNTAAGLVLGMIAGLAFIYLFPKRELRLRRDPYDLTVPSIDALGEPIAMPDQFRRKSARLTRMQPEVGYAVAATEPPQNLPIA
jgi:capsular polysaccharide biosynthesis protein